MTFEPFILQPNDWIPNNPKLPVILYRGALPSRGMEEMAFGFEQLFERNGWPPQWRDGVFDYHHYHSTAREVLGFAAGKARLMLGGAGARKLKWAPATRRYCLSELGTAALSKVRTSWSLGPIRRDKCSTSAGPPRRWKP
jgi:hypothetical protein